jgi:phosphoribosylanthranilate isomerase
MIEVKLCGNHSLTDFDVVTQSNAQFVGVIFAESKRKVEPEKLKEWLSRVELSLHQKLVGVFVNPTIQEIKDVLNHVSLDVIQLHGNETQAMIQEVSEHFNLPIFKAIHHEPPTSFSNMERLADYVEGFVVDSKVRGAWGGTGVTFDWGAIPLYVEKAKELNKYCFIAGGINPDNIKECLTYSPSAIDLSSGIERNGRKDRDLIRRLEERMGEI